MKEKEEKFTLWKFLAPYKFYLFGILLMFVATTVLGVLFTISLADTISLVSSGDYIQAFKLLSLSIIYAISRRLLWLWANMWFYKYSNQICANIGMELTKRCFKISSSTFSENNTGSFLQRVLTDPNQVLENIYYMIDLIADLITCAIIMIYIITLNWIIGTVYALSLGCLVVLEVIKQKVWKRNSKKIKEVEDKTYSLVNEIIKSERDIKALNMEEKLFYTAKDGLQHRAKINEKGNKIDCYFWSARNALVELLGLGVLMLGIFLLEKSLLTLGVYILVFSYRDSSWNLVWNFGAIMRYITDISVSTHRMLSLFDESLYPIDNFGDVNIKNIKGKIQFKNVDYAYEEVEEETGKKKKKEIKRVKKETLFKNLNFTIEPNTTVAFVGKSGSGKSTILSLIDKLITADKGKILIDGKDINTLSKETLRQNIALINQFPYIFDMSIRDNLLLANKNATDDDIWRVLESACFADDVKAMPKGLDTKVGETGVKLSGGQRQRLAIARALLKNAKIILFDESTSSLDNFAQKHIQQSIENLKGNHTIVIVAHRLSTIKNVDKMFYLENGEIIDSGTFDDLFENNKKFQSMFTIENI